MPKSQTKKSTVKKTKMISPSDNALAIISMVLGVTSLTGPGLIFGIPAIILAAIALKNNQGERALSMTGLITGIISTVLSVIVIMVLVLLFSWGATLPDDPEPEHWKSVMEHRI